MPSAIWRGTISFGLVSIPVRLFAATTSKSVRFHQIDQKTGARVRQQRISEADGHEVAYEDIVKGYEVAPGQYVIVTDEELAALEVEATHTVDLLEFVEQASIDPMYYESAYYLEPDEVGLKPYALLVSAMAEADRVGIAKIVMRSRERLAALRAVDGALVLSTMRFPDEIREVADLPRIAQSAEVQVGDKELKMAQQLIESLAEDFDPTKFTDTYREQVLELLARKEQGEEISVAAAPERSDDTVVDLMAALEASVSAAKGKGSAKGKGRTRRGKDDEDDEGTSDARKASA